MSKNPDSSKSNGIRNIEIGTAKGVVNAEIKDSNDCIVVTFVRDDCFWGPIEISGKWDDPKVKSLVMDYGAAILKGNVRTRFDSREFFSELDDGSPPPFAHFAEIYPRAGEELYAHIDQLIGQKIMSSAMQYGDILEELGRMESGDVIPMFKLEWLFPERRTSHGRDDPKWVQECVDSVHFIRLWGDFLSSDIGRFPYPHSVPAIRQGVRHYLFERAEHSFEILQQGIWDECFENLPKTIYMPGGELPAVKS